MKLKTGTTYWASINGPSPKVPALSGTLSCDVAVIGGGITGALVAHRLVKAGFDVVVVDKRPAGTGSTSASTALLLYETDTSLAQLSRRHGRAAAVRAYALGREAIREIGRIARELRVNCGFRRRHSLYLASDGPGVNLLRAERHHRRAADFPVQWLTRAQLRARFGLDFPAALYSPGAAQVDAMALARGLLRHHARRRALRIFSGRVTRVDPAADGVTLRTARRARLQARYVVVATGYEAAPFLADGLVDLNSSYVIASQPQPADRLWAGECLIWETARPYFYARVTPDRRVLLGGEDEPFADPVRRDAKLPAKTAQLLARAGQLFPRIPFEVDFAWTGTFGESRDGLPYIGPRPGSPRVLYALGYGGNGITFSQIAAKLIAQMCRGRTPHEAALFRFDR